MLAGRNIRGHFTVCVALDSINRGKNSAGKAAGGEDPSRHLSCAAVEG